MDTEDLPGSWVVWNEESGGRVVLAYRPDVFDADTFPASCLPTLYVTRGGRGRRPPQEARQGSGAWHVTLYLEPEVSDAGETYPTRSAAIDGAVERAREFDRGDVDYRSLYQVPREEYLDRLDELTGP